ALHDEFARDVEADHLGWNLGREDSRQGFGIAPGVEFRKARLIAGRFDVADHGDVAAHFLAYHGGVGTQRECEAGDRAQCDESNGLGLLAEQPLQGTDVVQDHAGRRHFGVAEARGTMGIRRDVEWTLERPARADPHWYADGTLHFTKYCNGISERIFDICVAIRDRYAANVELGGVQGEQQCQTIVDAGIGINDYGDWGPGTGIGNGVGHGQR